MTFLLPLLVSFEDDSDLPRKFCFTPWFSSLFVCLSLCLLQQNPDDNWRCRLMQVDLYNGCKMVVMVVVLLLGLLEKRKWWINFQIMWALEQESTSQIYGTWYSELLPNGCHRWTVHLSSIRDEKPWKDIWVFKMCKSVNYVSAVFNVMVRLDLPSDVTGLTCQLLYFHAVILIQVIYTYAFAPSFACKVTTHHHTRCVLFDFPFSLLCIFICISCPSCRQ